MPLPSPSGTLLIHIDAIGIVSEVSAVLISFKSFTQGAWVFVAFCFSIVEVGAHGVSQALRLAGLNGCGTWVALLLRARRVCYVSGIKPVFPG